MSPIIGKAALVLLLPGLCVAHSMTPAEALDRYLAGSLQPQTGCSDSVFAIQIEASLPKLGKHGSMRGLKLVSRTGRIVYDSLRFTGDSLVKTAVIARYLAIDAQPPEEAAGAGVTRQNYSFAYDRTSDYNGLMAYVFLLRPKRKRVGLFKGELWLQAESAAPLRLWGDFVKSPSIFVRGFRFVQDYQNLDQCSRPLRLLLTVRTRIVGQAEMAVWLRSAAGGSPAAGTTECGAESVSNCVPER
jgi:hypothetical protein